MCIEESTLRLSRLSAALPGNSAGKLPHNREITVVKAAPECHHRIQDRHPLHARQHIAHELPGYRSPRSVLYQPDSAVAETFACQMVQENMHGGEKGTVVSDGTEHHMAQTESLGHGIGDIMACEVEQHHLAGSLLTEHCRHTAGSFGGAAVNGGGGDDVIPAGGNIEQGEEVSRLPGGGQHSADAAFQRGDFRRHMVTGGKQLTTLQ